MKYCIFTRIVFNGWCCGVCWRNRLSFGRFTFVIEGVRRRYRVASNTKNTNGNDVAFNVDMSSLPMDVDTSVSVESASAGPAVPKSRNDTSFGTGIADPPGNAGPVVTAAVAGTAGSVSISLHPLVIMNISEHWTRLRAQEGSPQTGWDFVLVPLLFFFNTVAHSFFCFAVIGALIGKQKGRNIEVMNSFELVFCVIAGDVIIDREYYNMKEAQCIVNSFYYITFYQRLIFYIVFFTF